MDAMAAVVDSILGPRRLNVTAGGSFYLNVPCPQWYGAVAQVGDRVLLQPIGQGEWAVTMCLDDTDRLYRQPLPHAPRVTVQGTAPAGQTLISAVYAARPSLDTPDLTFVWASEPPAPPAAPSTLVFTPLSSGTYDNYFSGWRTDDNKVRQGGDGNAKGLWFFGAGAFASLASVTPARIQLTVTRYDGVNGSYGSVQANVRLHNHAAQPGGAPTLADTFPGPSIGKGETATFDLPLSWAAALKAGTAAGVGLGDGELMYVLGAGGPSGQLTITTT